MQSQSTNDSVPNVFLGANAQDSFIPEKVEPETCVRAQKVGLFPHVSHRHSQTELVDGTLSHFHETGSITARYNSVTEPCIQFMSSPWSGASAADAGIFKIDPTTLQNLS